MDYLITFEDGSSGYLSHYGVKGMKWGKHLKANPHAMDVSSGGGGVFNEENDPIALARAKLREAGDRFDDAMSTARQKIEEAGSHLPENPLYRLKVRTEQAEASGESDAARRRLQGRYSVDAVLGKRRPGNQYELRL